MSLESRAREPRAGSFSFFFCACYQLWESNWDLSSRVSRFARAIRGRESKAIRSERTILSQTALLDGQQRSANGPAPGKPVLRRRPRDASLFATTPLSTKQKIMCRPGRRWGWGPRFDAPGAGRTVRGRTAATRFCGAVLRKARPGEVPNPGDSSLTRRDGRRQELIDRA